MMSRVLKQLLCIFPFEEKFFNDRGVPTTFIGHPLARIVKPAMSRAEFCAKFGLQESDRIVVLLPGSRHGEVARHVPYLIDSSRLIDAGHSVPSQPGSPDQKLKYVLALPSGFGIEKTNFSEPLRAAAIQVIEGFTWDCLAYAEVALAASGTVTIEAALSGTPESSVRTAFYYVRAHATITPDELPGPAELAGLLAGAVGGPSTAS